MIFDLTQNELHTALYGPNYETKPNSKKNIARLTIHTPQTEGLTARLGLPNMLNKFLIGKKILRILITLRKKQLYYEIVEVDF